MHDVRNEMCECSNLIGFLRALARDDRPEFAASPVRRIQELVRRNLPLVLQHRETLNESCPSQEGYRVGALLYPNRFEAVFRRAESLLQRLYFAVAREQFDKDTNYVPGGMKSGTCSFDAKLVEQNWPKVRAWIRDFPDHLESADRAAPPGAPGRAARTQREAEFANEKRKLGKTWKEITREWNQQEKLQRTSAQVRESHRRFYGDKSVGQNFY